MTSPEVEEVVKALRTKHPSLVTQSQIMARAADLLEAKDKQIAELEARWDDRFCSRCEQLACNAVAVTCADEPCPLRSSLSTEWLAKRERPGFKFADPKFPRSTQEKGG